MSGHFKTAEEHVWAMYITIMANVLLMSAIYWVHSVKRGKQVFDEHFSNDICLDILFDWSS